MFNERVNVRYIAHKQAFANNQSVYRESDPVANANIGMTKKIQYKQILKDGFWDLEYRQQREIINYLFKHNSGKGLIIKNHFGRLIYATLSRNESGTELKIMPYDPSLIISYIWVTEDGIEHEAFYEDIKNVFTKDYKEVIRMKRLISYINDEITDDFTISKFEAKDYPEIEFLGYSEVPSDKDINFEEHILENNMSLNDQRLSFYTALKKQYPNISLTEISDDSINSDYFSERHNYKELFVEHFDNVEIAKLLYGMLPKYEKTKQFSK